MALSCSRIAIDSSGSLITALSVSSTSRYCGWSPASSSARRIVWVKPLPRNCEGERFTEMRMRRKAGIVPGARLAASLAHHPLADGADQAAFLGETE